VLGEKWRNQHQGSALKPASAEGQLAAVSLRERATAPRRDGDPAQRVGALLSLAGV